MKQKLNTLDRNVEIMYADSLEYDMTKKHYLPGGMMNALWRKIVQFYDKELMTVDKLGKWIGFKLTNQLKTILVITVYRIPYCTGGVYSALSQYNQADSKIRMLQNIVKNYSVRLKST